MLMPCLTLGLKHDQQAQDEREEGIDLTHIATYQLTLLFRRHHVRHTDAIAVVVDRVSSVGTLGNGRTVELGAVGDALASASAVVEHRVLIGRTLRDGDAVKDPRVGLVIVNAFAHAIRSVVDWVLIGRTFRNRGAIEWAGIVLSVTFLNLGQYRERSSLVVGHA